MTDIQHQELLTELKAIRALLASKPAAAAHATATATPQAATQTPDGPPPQPDSVIENAAQVCVHFGKNNGVALGALSERSLGWYATEQPPRLDSSGKPYPPRPQEILLRNAARTLWHTQKGTLGTPAQPPKSTAAVASADDEESIPF